MNERDYILEVHRREAARGEAIIFAAAAIVALIVWAIVEVVS